MECQLKLNLGKVGSFGLMKMLKKYHTDWPSQNGTCFTNFSSGQKFEKILEESWLDEICPNWVDIGYIDNIRLRNICSHNGAR